MSSPRTTRSPEGSSEQSDPSEITSPMSSSFFSIPLFKAINGFRQRLLSNNPSDDYSEGSSSLSQSLPSRRPASDERQSYLSPERPRLRYASQSRPPRSIGLLGYNPSVKAQSRIMDPTIAEEVRILLPGRQNIVRDWTLVFSLAQHGASLPTMYRRCKDVVGRGQRGGYVLAVRDYGGNIFGSYLTHAPVPSTQYHGSSDSFLWKASTIQPILQAVSRVEPVVVPTDTTLSTSDPNRKWTTDRDRDKEPQSKTPHMDLLIFDDEAEEAIIDAALESLPLPPSADTTHATRNSVIGTSKQHLALLEKDGNIDSASFTTEGSPLRRFQSFPYTGDNDYVMFCQNSFLSVGGGDGRYGLWLNDTFAEGSSSACATFANEPLSSDGARFGVLGVELWYVGIPGS